MKRPESLAVGSKPAPDELIYVQGFVNTLDVETGSDALAEPSGVAAWFSAHGSLPVGTRVSDVDRTRVVAVRDALRSLVREPEGARLSTSDRETLNEVSARSPLALKLSGAGEAVLEAPGSDLDSQLAELLVIVHRSQLTGTWDRLKICAADSCQWAFYDSSRNRSGTWCSMEVCGNREKVRAHRAKH